MEPESELKSESLRFHKQARVAARKASSMVHNFPSIMPCRDFMLHILQTHICPVLSWSIGSMEYVLQRGHQKAGGCAETVDSPYKRLGRHGPWIKNLGWKLSADWQMLRKRHKVRKLCDHFAALCCKDRVNQSAARELPSDWLI